MDIHLDECAVLPQTSSEGFVSSTRLLLPLGAGISPRLSYSQQLGNLDFVEVVGVEPLDLVSPVQRHSHSVFDH